jgi:nitrate reductase delta subunit
MPRGSGACPPCVRTSTRCRPRSRNPDILRRSGRSGRRRGMAAALRGHIRPQAQVQPVPELLRDRRHAPPRRRAGHVPRGVPRRRVGVRRGRPARLPAGGAGVLGPRRRRDRRCSDRRRAARLAPRGHRGTARRARGHVEPVGARRAHRHAVASPIDAATRERYLDLINEGPPTETVGLSFLGQLPPFRPVSQEAP